MEAISLRHLAVGYLILTAFAIFGWSCMFRIRVMRKGRPFGGTFSGIGGRVRDVLLYFFGQQTVAREKLSWHHMPIFWGFLVITVGTLEILVTGIFGNGLSFRALLGEGVDNIFKAILDVTNGLVLLLILYAYFRRMVIKPRLIPMSGDAALILGLIALLCLSHFLSHGFHHVAASAGQHRRGARPPRPLRLHAGDPALRRLRGRQHRRVGPRGG